jgi:hypothetical protein
MPPKPPPVRFIEPKFGRFIDIEGIAIGDRFIGIIGRLIPPIPPPPIGMPPNRPPPPPPRPRWA